MESSAEPKGDAVGGVWSMEGTTDSNGGGEGRHGKHREQGGRGEQGPHGDRTGELHRFSDDSDEEPPSPLPHPLNADADPLDRTVEGCHDPLDRDAETTGLAASENNLHTSGHGDVAAGSGLPAAGIEAKQHRVSGDVTAAMGSWRADSVQANGPNPGLPTATPTLPCALRLALNSTDHGCSDPARA